jgi:hypothetical protein
VNELPKKFIFNHKSKQIGKTWGEFPPRDLEKNLTEIEKEEHNSAIKKFTNKEKKFTNKKFREIKIRNINLTRKKTVTDKHYCKLIYDIYNMGSVGYQFEKENHIYFYNIKYIIYLREIREKKDYIREGFSYQHEKTGESGEIPAGINSGFIQIDHDKLVFYELNKETKDMFNNILKYLDELKKRKKNKLVLCLKKKNKRFGELLNFTGQFNIVDIEKKIKSIMGSEKLSEVNKPFVNKIDELYTNNPEINDEKAENTEDKLKALCSINKSKDFFTDRLNNDYKYFIYDHNKNMVIMEIEFDKDLIQMDKAIQKCSELGLKYEVKNINTNTSKNTIKLLITINDDKKVNIFKNGNPTEGLLDGVKEDFTYPHISFLVKNGNTQVPWGINALRNIK